MNKRLFISTLFVFFTCITFAQDFSNKGKDFWLGYGYHVNMGAGVTGAQVNAQDMILYLTSNVNANVTVEIPALGYSQNYTVTANQVTVTNPLPKTGTQDCRINDTGFFNRGIHLYSNQPIVAYAHIYNSSVSGASLLFPTNTLGRDYYAISFTQNSNANFANNFFFVIATEDNTTVEITPSAANKNNKPSGVPFTITLNKGQVYSVFGTTSGNSGTDLTGSRIRSVSTGTGGGCKRIAVFSGAGKTSIGVSTPGGTTTASGSADNLFAQAFPANAWGKRYLTSPTGSQPNNFYRVCVSDPTTVVKLNGIIIPTTSLINGFYYQFRNSSASITTSTAAPNLIEADKPVIVAQYCTTQGMEGNPSVSPGGDPEMIFLSPVEQTINNITLYSANKNLILQSYINVIIKNTGINSFKLDGVFQSGSFTVHPRDANYSYASFPVTSNASHSLYSDTGFNAIAYGFGSAESYGYNAGTNVIDLYQYVSLQNQYATVNFPSTCKNTPFYFSITLPYLPTALTWDFNSNPNLTPNSTIISNTPIPDSVFVRDGKTLYLFKLSGIYTFGAAGTYPVKVIANNPTPDGCSGVQEISYDVVVYDPPIADWSYTHSGCLSDSVKFFDAGNGFGRQFIKWNWTFGDGGVDSVKNPIKKYASVGTYNVRLRSITDIGCVADTTKPITLAAQPTAKFKVSDTTCIGNIITYSDSSYINGGNIVKWYWDLGNGTQVTNLTNADVTTTYSAAGSYTVTLQVENNTGCKSVVFSKVINIRPKPIPDFVLPTTVCLPAGSAQFTNATTISDASQATITYLWNFGNGNTSTLLNPSTTYSNVGPFNVLLTATSIYGCTKDTTKILSTIYPRPTADFIVTPEVCLRDTTLFTDASNGFGSTITKWRWDFGDASIDTVQNPKHAYSSANSSYTVKLFVYSDKGCISDTMTKTTLVNPLPTASFTTTSPLCELRNIGFTTTSVANVGNITKWYWDMGNTIVNNFTNNNPFNQTYNAWGNFTVKHMVETNKGCKSDTINTVLNIHALPVPDFSLPTICLPIGASIFNNLTTIADGTLNTVTYDWNFGDGGTATTFNGVHNYTSTGPFLVKLTATSQYGCTNDSIKNLTTVYPAPLASFTVTPETCLRDSTLFTNTSNPGAGNTISNWYWNRNAIGGGNFVDTLSSYKYRYGAAGSYTAKMYFKTDKGCFSDTATVPLIINPLPQAQFINTNPLCEKNIVQFSTVSLPSVGNIARWYWDMGNGVVNNFNNNNAFNQSYITWGNYTVKHMVETNKGCKSDTLAKVLSIRPLPQVGFILPEVCLADAAAVFIDTSKIADGTQAAFTYAWEFNLTGVTPGPTPSTSTIKNASTKFNKAANYQVKLKVTSGAGCIDSLTSPFTVNGSIPVADFNILTPNTLCSNLPVKIQNTSLVDFGWLTKLEIYWDYANNPTIKFTDNDPQPNGVYSNTYPNFQQPASKTYTIRFVAFSGGTCVSIKTKNVTIYASPKVSFQTMPGICLESNPRQITQANEIGNVPGAFTYSGTGVNSTGLFNPASSGAGTFNIQYLYISNSIAGCRDSVTKPITVWPSPTAIWNYSSPTCEKNDISFNNSSLANYSNITSWKWDFGDGTNQTRTNGNTFTKRYLLAGNYSASLIVKTDSGCTSLPLSKPIAVHYLPRVGFIVPNVCLPSGIGTFTDTSSIPDATQAQFTYDWNFGDGGTDFIKNPVHQFTAAGPFNIKLKVTSVDGCIDSLIKPINTIYPQPHADFTVNPSTKDVCLGRPFGFTSTSASSNGGIVSWNWNFGDGSNTVTINNPVYTYATASSFNVQLFAYDSKGCVSDTMVKAVNVHALPIAVWGYTLPTCERNGITFSDTSIPNFNSISSWSWSFGDGTTQVRNNNSSFSKTYVTVGNYNVTLKVTSDTGCISLPVIKQIVVHPLPLVGFTIPNICLPDGNGVFNDTSKISDGTQSQFSYAWSFGDGGTDIVKSPTHQYFAVGPYNVQLKVTSVDGCIDSLTKPINTIYPQPHADFTINPNTAEVCIGATFNFSDASTSSNGSINSWQWSFGDGGQSTIKNPSHIYTNANTFSVKLFAFDAKGCVSDTMIKPVTVHSYPVVDAGPDLFVLQDGTGILKATATGNNLQYAWLPTLYLDSPNVLRPTIIYPQNDITYTLTVTALGGCSKSDNVFIKVLKTPIIPNAFSPNGDGINDKWNIKYLESYPEATVEVFNRYGQKVFSSKGYTTPWDGSFKGSPLPVATYYYIVNPGNGRKQLSGSITILK